MTESLIRTSDQRRWLYVLFAVLPIPCYWIVAVSYPVLLYGFFETGGIAHLASVILIAGVLASLLLSRRTAFRALGYTIAFMTAMSPLHYGMYIFLGMMGSPDRPAIHPLLGALLLVCLVCLALSTLVATRFLIKSNLKLHTKLPLERVLKPSLREGRTR